MSGLRRRWRVAVSWRWPGKGETVRKEAFWSQEEADAWAGALLVDLVKVGAQRVRVSIVDRGADRRAGRF